MIEIEELFDKRPVCGSADFRLIKDKSFSLYQRLFQPICPLQETWVVIDEPINVRDFFFLFVSNYILVVVMNKDTHLFSQLIRVEIVCPIITSRYNTRAKNFEYSFRNSHSCLSFFLITNRQELVEPSIESFGQPRMPLIRLNLLPINVAAMLLFLKVSVLLLLAPILVNAGIVDISHRQSLKIRNTSLEHPVCSTAFRRVFLSRKAKTRLKAVLQTQTLLYSKRWLRSTRSHA